jgi:hypothetical protein
MKARILPVDDFAEYGKTGTVVMVMSLNPTEAAIILDYLAMDENLFTGEQQTPTAVRLLEGYLRVVSDRANSEQNQDIVNTDSRALKSRQAIAGLNDRIDELQDQVRAARGHSHGVATIDAEGRAETNHAATP